MTLMAEGLADSHRSLASGEDFQDRMPEEDFHGSNVMNFDAAMPRRLPGAREIFRPDTIAYVVAAG